MALPFIAGLAVGAGVALLFTKREQIKEKLGNSEISEKLNSTINKGKEFSNHALNYAKNSFKNALNAEPQMQEAPQNVESKTAKQRTTRKTIKKEN